MRSLVVIVLATLTLAPVAAAAFPQTAPNDPDYAPAEQGGPETCYQVSVNNEEHYLYSFMPKCATNAKDPEGASGMSVDEAWAKHTIGSPDVVIAYVEGGINWHQDGARDLVDQVFLNKGELPLPAGCAVYDCNGDGVFNVKDYAGDPRVSDTNGNGYVDPEDLIVAFSDGVDQDGNGFVDDISGWDFYDHQNDPATLDSTYGHANGQMLQAAAEGNNGFGGIGVCPGCRILPIKAGAEALDRTDDLAQAWNYADTIGASVVVSVTADLGYSHAMAQTVERLWRDGVVMVEASNDFDSTDHQGGMFWPHVLPGNGLVTNTQGMELGSPFTSYASNVGIQSFDERSGYTSWGTHNVFSVATQGGTTSESTPTVGGVMALVLSEGRKLSPPLSGPEAIQVVRATSLDISDPSLAWAGKPGWDVQYGYGRPNVEKAMEAVDAGAIPPVPSIDSPSWYQVYDPTTTSSVQVFGSLARHGGGMVSWRLEWALGAEPNESAWTLIGSGDGSVPASLEDAPSVPLGAIDLTQVPQSFWDAPFKLSSSKSLETNEQYTVSVRLRAFDANGLMGEDRRAIAVHHDPALLWGGAKRIASGDSQPAIATLQGHTAVIFGDADGNIHALRGTDGAELPGFPAHTDAVDPDVPVEDVSFGHEPIIAPVAVGDLGSGSNDIIATSTSGHVYVIDEHGARVRSLDATLGAVSPAIPRPASPFTRLPHAGATASPVLFDLDGDGQLDIIQASWDGRVYAWHADGSAVAGWPVTVQYAGALTPGHKLVNDHKLVVTPAIADLDGDGLPELVVVSQMTEVVDSGLQPFGVLHVFAFHHDGSIVAGWPATIPSVVEYYGSAQEFLTEGSTAPAVADVDHDGKDEVAVSPVLSPTVLLGGDGKIRAAYGLAPDPFEPLLGGIVPLDAATGNMPTDAPVTFTTSGAFGVVGAGPLSYVQPGSGGGSVAVSLLLSGSGHAIHNQERAYDAATGATRPGFPATIQGLNFLGAPAIADVDGDGLPDVVDGGDSSALHAFTAAGTLASGFPKFTTGWTLFTPAVGDINDDGHTDVVALTREGYLLAWGTPGDASKTEWGTYHHDNWRTGDYNVHPPTVGASTLRAAAPWSLLPVIGIAAGVAFRRRS